MGTNYYIDQEGDCPTCTRTHICQVHLGKSSMGWKFTFAWNGGEYYKNLEEMREWTKGRQIYNEYDEKVSYKEFWDMVERKQNEGLDHITYEHTRGSHLEHGVVVDGIYFMEGEFS